jgi:transcriptional regulator with XRE-family HTH domain
MTPHQLRAALKRLRLSQSEAARRLGVQQSTMYRWLAGERKIPGPVIAALKCWAALLPSERNPQ